MPPKTIERFAEALGVPVGGVIEQLAKAGVIGRKPSDTLSDLDKSALLDYLRRQHGAHPKKTLTVVRRQSTEIKTAGPTGKARTIHVEVRKKCVLLTLGDTEVAPESQS